MAVTTNNKYKYMMDKINGRLVLIKGYRTNRYYSSTVGTYTVIFIYIL